MKEEMIEYMMELKHTQWYEVMVKAYFVDKDVLTILFLNKDTIQITACTNEFVLDTSDVKDIKSKYFGEYVLDRLYQKVLPELEALF